MTNVSVFKNTPRVVVSRNGVPTVVTEKVRSILDTSRIITGETPTPATNGVLTVFTVAYPYVAGSLQVTRASLRMHPTVDFTETDPASGTFTMAVAPDTVEPLIVDYLKT